MDDGSREIFMLLLDISAMSHVIKKNAGVVILDE